MMSAVVQAPVDLIEAVADLRFPAATDQILQQLMDRNNEGELASDEKQKLEALVELSESMSLLRAKAPKLLGRKPPAMPKGVVKQQAATVPAPGSPFAPWQSPH